ncbi:high-affinity iron permease [Knufia obscura]|uniref:High-affinity iron permease n=2 Tax=Knufia TaxID=430999 RepID=A0AAN8I6V9_9EURO|nr:high-affinity iron permease [Knufia obscura]KAK5952371.1 high-affinity iron permease [Knufia fluminis]
MVNVFAVPIFFILFRETLETVIIVSVLLSFLKQQLGPDRDPVIYKKLRKQVWLGTLVGLAICIVIGCGMIGAFYGLGTDKWASTEDIWEGVFSIIASLVISIMGAALLRVSKLQEKWRLKLAKAVEAKNSDHHGAGLRQKMKVYAEKYAMFVLPFITVLREGLEAVVFIGGISLGLPATAIPLPTITGLLAGFLIGFLIYRGGNKLPLQIFLIVSTCFLYLVAAGLFSRAIWYLEQHAWAKATGGDASENGSGPGSYDIRKSVWHVNCCNPELNGGGGWGIFNALLGWQNSATYGSVIGYNMYWLTVIVGFVLLRFKEKRGRWPFMKAKPIKNDVEGEKKVGSDDSSSDHAGEKGDASVKVHGSRDISPA